MTNAQKMRINNRKKKKKSEKKAKKTEKRDTRVMATVEPKKSAETIACFLRLAAGFSGGDTCSQGYLGL